MEIKIKSITDIITNSSDETYIIKTSKSPAEVSGLIRDWMDEHNKKEVEELKQDFPDGCTIYPDLVEKAGFKKVRVSWECMCNLEDAQAILSAVFGEENIKEE